MPLSKRIVKVTLTMPSGDVVLDQSIYMRLRIRKDALAIQNTCSIDVIGLTTSFREKLLSQFTAWNKRHIDQGDPELAAQAYVPIKVEAGYMTNGIDNTGVVFKGFVILTVPTTPPPNIGARIDCNARQVDKLQWITGVAPSNITFRDYIKWAGKQMGFEDGNIICSTSHDNDLVSNPGRSSYVVESLIVDIQNYEHPSVAAFVDNDQLIVKDINKIIDPGKIAQVSEFIGIPQWNAWGVEFQTLLTPQIQLAGGVNLQSRMNPGINNNYVVTTLEYDLATRDVPFYVKATASPPAQ